MLLHQPRLAISPSQDLGIPLLELDQLVELIKWFGCGVVLLQVEEILLNSLLVINPFELMHRHFTTRV
jgi:hypothetical protein